MKTIAHLYMYGTLLVWGVLSIGTAAFLYWWYFRVGKR